MGPLLRPMKRALSIAIVVLLGVALTAPAAQAGRTDPQHTRYRYFQDLNVTGAYPAEVSFGLLYKQNRSEEFTPREMMGYSVRAQSSCNPSGQAPVSASANAFSKYGYFHQTLTNGLFSTRLENPYENPAMAPIKGDLHGKVLKREKRGGRVIRTARVNGSFNVENFDPDGPAGAQQNCVASGTFSATTCKRRMSPRSPNFGRWKRWKVPKCGHLPW